jgi:hypothetical protein
MPNITALTIRSKNSYIGSPISTTASGTVIRRYDNTTNVGDNISFQIDWSDANQSSNNSEFVKVFICNSSDFINNTGCRDRTLYYQYYTNADPINIVYTAQHEDSSIQNISVYLCDDSLDCSYTISTNIFVNHKPGNFTPDIISYASGNDTLYECDYSYPYIYENGSNDTASSGEMQLNDTVASADYRWYVNSGSGYIRMPWDGNATITGDIGSNDKLICSVSVTDVYDMQSTFQNSSVYDLSKTPVLWPLASRMLGSTYVMNITTIHPNNISIIGYLPNDAIANITATSYSGYSQPHTNNTDNLASCKYVCYPRDPVNNYIAYIRCGSMDCCASFELCSPYYERYYINATPFEISPNIYRINLAEPLNSSTNVDDVVSVYTGKYPYGWFNLTLEVHNGTNNIYVRSNKSGALGPAARADLAYDYATPTISIKDITSPTFDTTPMLYFNLSDDFYVNTSTLLVNLSNGTYHTYHFTSSTSYDKTSMTAPANISLGSDVNCIETNRSFYECSVQLDTSWVTAAHDDYKINITVADFLNNTGNATTNFTVNTADIFTPVLFRKSATVIFIL